MHTVNSRVSHKKIPGDKNERWVPLALHIAGSDVAMLAHKRLRSPRWLQFA